MKKISFILFVIIFFASCDGKISPETSKAFIGEYWMESTTIGVTNGTEELLSPSSTWTPVSIYEESSKLYVQTEWFGAPDTESEHPEEIEGTRERPNFMSQRRVRATERDEEPNQGGGVDNVEVTNKVTIAIVNACIIAINRGVRAKSLPIKVKSGSETILYLKQYKPVEVELTDMAGESLGKMRAWYEYGPMVQKGEKIAWDVDYKDDYTYDTKYDRVVHRNTLYKR